MLIQPQAPNLPDAIRKTDYEKPRDWRMVPARDGSYPDLADSGD